MQEQRSFIRDKLFEFNLTQAFLITELERRYGILTERSEISSILKGTRRGSKAESIITNSVEILKDFEEKYRNET